jgi:KDO2-lipid IV(A) lauroyltransferase
MRLIIKKIIHIFEYIVTLVLWKIFRIMPIDLSSYIGGRLLSFVGRFLSVNNTVKKNLAKILPDLTIAERDKIVLNMWDNLGRVIGELPHWSQISNENLKKRVEIEFPDGNEKILSAMSGVICLSAHTGNWEIYCRVLNFLGIKFNLLYRPANNIYVDNLINKNRGYNSKLIKKGYLGVRQILKAIKNGECVGMLVDQRTDDGVTVPFMNFSAKTTPAPANLAIKYKAPLIMSRVIRTKGANYKIQFYNPIEILESDDETSIMTKVNEVIGNWVRQYPEQWFWVHKRWGKNF